MLQLSSLLDLNFSFLANFNTSILIDELNIYNYFFYQTHVFLFIKFNSLERINLKVCPQLLLCDTGFGYFWCKYSRCNLKKEGKAEILIMSLSGISCFIWLRCGNSKEIVGRGQLSHFK